MYVIPAEKERENLLKLRVIYYPCAPYVRAHQNSGRRVETIKCRHYLQIYVVAKFCELNFNSSRIIRRNMHNMWLISGRRKTTLIIPKLIFIWFHNTIPLFLCLLSISYDEGIDYYKTLLFATINFIHFSSQLSTRVNESHVFFVSLLLLTNNSSRRWNISLFIQRALCSKWERDSLSLIVHFSALRLTWEKLKSHALATSAYISCTCIHVWMMLARKWYFPSSSSRVGDVNYKVLTI